MLMLERHVMPPNFAISGHGHARPHLVIVEAGNFDHEIGRDIHAVKTQGVRLSRACAEHRLAFGSGGATCVIFEAGGAFWERVFVRALGRRESAFASLTAEQAQALKQSLTAEDITASPQTLRAFGRTLAALKRPESEPPPWLEEMIEMLDRGAALKITALAEKLRRDRTHLTRSFADHLGFLPSEYRMLRRAAAAAGAVRAADTRLCDIALEYGFAHQSHMTNTFRTLFGVSPSRLRNA